MRRTRGEKTLDVMKKDFLIVKNSWREELIFWGRTLMMRVARVFERVGNLSPHECSDHELNLIQTRSFTFLHSSYH